MDAAQRQADSRAAASSSSGAANPGQDVLTVLHDLSTLLNTGLDKEQLRACVNLIEDGVGPEAVAMLVKELRAKGKQ